MNNTAAALPPIKPAKVRSALKRIIDRHQHKIVWIGMPLLCLAINGMLIAGAVALWR